MSEKRKKKEKKARIGRKKKGKQGGRKGPVQCQDLTTRRKVIQRKGKKKETRETRLNRYGRKVLVKQVTPVSPKGSDSREKRKNGELCVSLTEVQIHERR